MEALEGEVPRSRAFHVVAGSAFVALETDARFEALAQALRAPATRPRAEAWVAHDGTHAAKFSRTGKKLTLVFDDRVAPLFGDFIRGRLGALYTEYKAANSASNGSRLVRDNELGMKSATN
jgi:ParB family transcriptional regulator, chromosome partitioning protein